MLLLDNSGSMWNSLDTAKDACRRLLGDMLDLSLHRAGFATFETNVVLRAHLTHDRNELLGAVDPVRSGSSTNMAEAFRVAGRELSGSQNMCLVIIVTDGVPDSKWDASREAETLKNNGIKIAAIGAGDIDHDYLSTLATTNKDYYQIGDMGALGATFKTIVQGLRRR